MKKIAIIGLGKLGIDIANELKSKGYSVVGTTTTLEKKTDLSKRFDKVEVFQLSDQLEKLKSMANSELVVLTIPPSAIENYSQKLIHLISFLKKENPDLKFIYTSSISVYGSKARMVTINSSLDLQTKNAKKINEVESHLLTHLKEQSIVLRLAGLVGENRHPVKFLKDKKENKKPFAGVNLVHHKDISSFVLASIKSFQFGIFNLCCIDHPSKINYYNWEAKRRNYAKIDFNEKDKSLDKVVISNFEKQKIFKLKYSSPYDFPL